MIKHNDCTSLQMLPDKENHLEAAKPILKIGVFGMSADAMFCGVLPFDPLGERECGAGHGIGAHSAGA